MLRRPDWKRTRQACGSSWRLIPLCPGKRGVTGEGKSLLGALGDTSPRLSERCRSGAASGQVVTGKKERWVPGRGQQCQGRP